MEKLKILGELLSNESSIAMIKLLTKKECIAADITSTLGLRTSLVIYHLNKLKELGIVEITEKPRISKHLHKYYKIDPDFLQKLERLL